MAISKKYQKQDFALEVMKLMEALREEIKRQNAVATGNMINFTYDIHTTANSVRITINLPEYFKYLNKGVNGVKQNNGSPYSFHSEFPSRKMVDSILQWITVKRIIPRSKTTGRFIKKEQGAYAISRGILKNGLKPRRFTDQVKNKQRAIMKDIKQMVAQNLMKDAEDIVQTFYQK